MSAAQSGAAGLGAGVATTLLLYPLDVVKTRMQVNANHSTVQLWRGLRESTKHTFRTAGVRGFYAGATPAIFGSAVAWGSYFYVYSHAKKALRETQGVTTLSWDQHLLAATGSGLVVCLLTHPIWTVKTRMQAIDASHASGAYTHLRTAVSSMLRSEGAAGFYRGLSPAILATSHGGLQFMFYEEARQVMATYFGGASLVPAGGFFALGAVSKVFAATATYPLQTVRNRMMMPQDMRLAEPTLRATVRSIARTEGLVGFFRGIVPNTLRVAPGSAVTLMTYEVIMRVASWLNGDDAEGKAERTVAVADSSEEATAAAKP